VPTIIHVNTHVIRKNRKTGERKPPIAVRPSRTGKATYHTEFRFPGGRAVYSPGCGLPCGAVVWIELD